MKPIRIALTKGRLENKTVELLERLGYDCTNARKKGRKLIMPIGNGEIEVVLAKAADVVTYVESGVCDMGVVGKDTIMEKGGTFYEVADLGFGKCRFAVATLKEKDLYEGYRTLTIASKYVNVAKNYFEQKNMDVDVVKIEGSVELAPVLGLADAIVDIVETGTTLKENGLVVKEEVCPVSARLIVNIASMKLRKKEIEELKKEGMWFVCADMGGTTMYDLDLKGSIGLVIGNEGKGVSRLVKEKCDFVASIPMFGDIDSLNASVATGVLAYEIVRQRMGK